MDKLVMDMSRLPMQLCPWCWTKLDAASNIFNSGPPAPGDVTICIVCAAVLCFDENLRLKASSLGEVPIEIRAKVARVKYTVEEMKKERRVKPWRSQ